MTVWQPSTNRLWEFFQRRSWPTDGTGLRRLDVERVRLARLLHIDSWPGLSQSYWGSTATSLPAIAGTMMISELKSGVIPHALAMNIPWAKPKTYSWPAQRSDGPSTDPNAIPRARASASIPPSTSTR